MKALKVFRGRVNRQRGMKQQGTLRNFKLSRVGERSVHQWAGVKGESGLISKCLEEECL